MVRRAQAFAEVLVRPLRQDDATQAAELLREVDELHARLSPGYFCAGPRARIGPAPHDGGAEQQSILVADRGGELLGLIHVRLFDAPDLPTIVPRRRAHVEDLVVKRSARRYGVGARLLDSAAEWARQRGAREVVLVVWRGNRVAERFYRALGFRPVHRVLSREIP
jgi:ribosomal protein S18 acetylase RimI-like enzyme